MSVYGSILQNTKKEVVRTVYMEVDFKANTQVC